MISDNLTKTLSFFQTVLSLLRDLILSVVVLLTIAIIYFGGNPKSLNALDWSKLVGSAFLIVVGPVIIFIIFKLVFKFFQDLFDFPRSLFTPGGSIPRGFFAWAIMKSKKQTKRQYVKMVREIQHQFSKEAENHSKASKCLKKLTDYYSIFYTFQNRSNPYLLAILTLIIAGYFFKKTMDLYIP